MRSTLVGASPSLCLSHRHERSERLGDGCRIAPVLEAARRKQLGGVDGAIIARRVPSASSATPSSDAAADATQPLQPSPRPSPSTSSSRSAFIFGLGYAGLGLACLLLEEGW